MKPPSEAPRRAPNTGPAAESGLSPERATSRHAVSGRPAMTHILKTWPSFFKAIRSGAKKFEIRKNDRDFRLGDHLLLREYDPEAKKYTHWKMLVYVTYIMHGPAFGGLAEGWCIMGIERDA